MEEEPEEQPKEEEEAPPEDPPEPGDWAVWITTGSNEGAETVNPVYLSVYGENNVFRDLELNKENYVKLKEESDKDVKEKILFDKGSTDEYKVSKTLSTYVLHFTLFLYEIATKPFTQLSLNSIV